VTSKSVSAQDVTEEYIDVSARLDNLERQEARLQEILNMTETVEDVLAVEKELERVRGEIESLTGRLNYLDDRIDFSTINIRVTEPRPITHSWGIRDALSESVNGFISMVNALIILVGYLLPLVIVLIFFGGAGVLIRRRLRR
jgi:predicted  nucleic acid-binding Zn-ribbon protein